MGFVVRSKKELRVGRHRRAALLAIGIVSTIRTAGAGANEWTNLGIYGGNIKAIAVDPKNPRMVYAATYGTVYKSVDGAATWTLAGAGLGGPYVISGMAIDPQDTSTLYVWNGALWRTKDGATTWDAVSLPARLAVSAVAIGPEGAVYVTGTIQPADYGPPHSSMILKSVDSGTTWVALTPPDHFVPGKLAVDSQTPGTIYLAGYTNPNDPNSWFPAFLKSTDAGVSWNAGAQPPAPVDLLVPDPKNANTLYAGTGFYTTGGGIYKTTDGGTTWSAANSGFPAGSVITLGLAIDPENPNTLYAVMGVPLWSNYQLSMLQSPVLPGSVFKSTDAGASWTEVSSGLDRLSFDTVNSDGDYGPLPLGLAVDPSNSGAVYLGTNGDGVFKSNDGGGTWNAANTGLAGVYIGSVVLNAQRPGTIYAVSPSRLFKSEDNGATWSAGSWGAAGLWDVSIAVDPRDSNTVYAGAPATEYRAGGLFLSTDSGQNWTVANVFSPAIRAQYSCGGADSLAFAQNALYVGSTSCGLYRSTDRGQTWTRLDALPDGMVEAIAIDPRNPDTIYTTGYVHSSLFQNGPNQVYKSVDGGVSWSVANSGLAGAGDVSVLLIDPASPTTLYAGAYNQDGWATYKTTDGAAIWQRLTSGYPLAIEPRSSTLYAALSGGLFRSTDGGATWIASGTLTGKLAFDPVDPNTVYAATGSGVYVITFVPGLPLNR